jgi:hypothetical protein
VEASLLGAMDDQGDDAINAPNYLLPAKSVTGCTIYFRNRSGCCKELISLHTKKRGWMDVNGKAHNNKHEENIPSLADKVGLATAAAPCGGASSAAFCACGTPSTGSTLTTNSWSDTSSVRMFTSTC